MSTQTKRQKAQVWIYRNHPEFKVLIFRVTPERGRFWQPVTGKVEDGESFEQGALREATEETQLMFISPLRGPVSEFEFESRGHLHEEKCFAIEAQVGLDPVLDPREHVEFKWVFPDDALKIIRYDSNKEALKQVLKRRLSWQL